MINFPVKGVGLQIHKNTYTDQTDCWLIVNAEGSIVEQLDLVHSRSKEALAQGIADLVAEASRIGFEQGVHSIRVALGVSK